MKLIRYLLSLLPTRKTRVYTIVPGDYDIEVDYSRNIVSIRRVR